MTSSRERGSVTALVLGLVATFVVCAGLVVDGGRVVSAYLTVADIAENAARSGTQELQSLRSGHPKLEPQRAARAAERYLRLAGVSGKVSFQGNIIIVTADRSVSFSLLRLIGLMGTRVSAVRHAEPMTQ